MPATPETISQDEWTALGRAVNIAHAIATGSIETVTTAIKEERAVKGTAGELAILNAMAALRVAGEAQITIANQAIERLRACALMVNEEALARLDVGTERA
jgi:hypothetical protein